MINKNFIGLDKKDYEIENPWFQRNNNYSRPFYSLKYLVEEYNDYKFYSQYGGISVIAVKDGKVLTECVTVAGAKRHLGI